MMKRALQWLAFITLLNTSSASCFKSEEIEEACLCNNGQSEEKVERLKCSSWCNDEEIVNMEILDQEKGHVSFSLVPSPKWCNHTSYTIELALHNETANQTEYLLHSISDMNLNHNCSTNCSEVVKVNFEFVFSGVYWLVIQPTSSRGSFQSCTSKKFNLTTYSFQPPSKTPLLLNDSFDRNFGIHADFNGVFDIGNPQSVHIILTADASSGSHDACVASGKQACCSMDIDPAYIESNKQNACECSWHRKSLRCDFFNITPGHYCINIDVDDHRCNRYTLWEKYFYPCKWHFNTTYQHAIAPTHEDSEGYLPIIIMVVIIALALIIMVAIIVEKKYLKKKVVVFFPPFVEDSSLEPLHPQKVLLLYPRDCQPFMDAMSNFRQFLNMVPNIEVFDIWDEDSFEVIAEVGVKHVFHLLSEGVKIILMATPLSRKFQQSLLSSENWNKLEYSDTELFDKIFPTILNHIYSIEDMYNKVLVVRFDGDDFKENVFEFISKGIVFTIPQHCDELILTIFGRNPALTRIEHGRESEYLSKLSNSITEYYNFCSSNPDYLDKLLWVNPQNGL